MMTNLDREWWSYKQCDRRCGRQRQLTIDVHWWDKRGGEYEGYCWQCYWAFKLWKDGPIVNCGPMWDMIDERRRIASHLKVDTAPERGSEGGAG